MIKILKLIWRLVCAPFRLLFFLSRTALIILFCATLALNVAMLTVSGVYAAASAALSAVGISTVAFREAGEAAAKRKAEKKIAREAARKTAERKSAMKSLASQTRTNIRQRISQRALRNSASAFAEGIPVVGVGVIATSLALEVKDNCDTARDMEALVAAVESEGDPVAAQQKAKATFDCKELIPSMDDLPSKEAIWSKVKSAPRSAFEGAAEFYEGVPGIDWQQMTFGLKADIQGSADWVRSLFFEDAKEAAE